MTNKEANEKYIVDEEIEFLGKPVGDNFVEPEKQTAGYENIDVQLLSATCYDDWVKGAFYASLATWDTTPHIPVSKDLESGDLRLMEKKLLYMLTKRPISVALEGAVFTFKVTGLPRSQTHQIVRHRQMSFGQQSYRVSSCYADPVRIPQTLLESASNKKIEDAEKELINNMIKRYEETVKKCRETYKELIESGIPMEQARNIMPMGTCTKIGITMRLRDMIDYFRGRTSGIAQDEHTYMVCLMAKEMKDKQSKFFDFIKTKVKNLENIMEQYGVR